MKQFRILLVLLIISAAVASTKKEKKGNATEIIGFKNVMVRVMRNQSYSVTVPIPTHQRKITVEVNIKGKLNQNLSTLFPVLIYVAGPNSSMTWALPYTVDGFRHFDSARLLCSGVIDPKSMSCEEHAAFRLLAESIILPEDTVFVHISSQSPDEITANFTLKFDAINNMVIGAGTLKPLPGINPAHPAVLLLNFGAETQALTIDLQSRFGSGKKHKTTDYTCGLILIQRNECPYHDMSQDPRSSLMHLTFLRRAYFVVQKPPDANQLLVIITSRPNSTACGPLIIVPGSQEKHLNLSIGTALTDREVLTPIFVLLGFFGSIVVAVMFGAVISAFVRNYLGHCRATSPANEHEAIVNHPQDDDEFENDTNDGLRTETTGTTKRTSVNGSADNATNLPTADDDVESNLISLGASSTSQSGKFASESKGSRQQQLPSGIPQERAIAAASFVHENVAYLGGGPLSAEASQTRAQSVTTDDTSCILKSALSEYGDGKGAKMSLAVPVPGRTNRTFASLQAVVSFFFVLPVGNSMILMSQWLASSGDLDICYVNFHCATPFKSLPAFNAVISNAGYVILGLLLAVEVRRQEYRWLKIVQKDERLGLNNDFGMAYAMAIVLCSLGVASAFYHVCPGSSAFQFDSTFIFVFCGLLVLYLYTLRHSSKHPHFLFAIMAIVLSACALGTGLTHKAYIWAISTLLQVIILPILSIHLYYKDHIYWDLYTGWQTLKTALIREPRAGHPYPEFLGRFIWLIIMNVLNIAITSGGAFWQEDNVTKYLLCNFIVQTVMYVGYYTLSKHLLGEEVSAISCLYLVASVVTWSGALMLFLAEPLTDWTLTAAESRELNKPCVLFGFYDLHDLWHVVSACALYCTAKAVLTLDDNQTITTVRRDKHHVF